MALKFFLAILLFMELVKSFSPIKEHEGRKEKIKESIKELVFPEEGPIKIFRDVDTNAISWEDPNNIMEWKKRREIESYVQLGGDESDPVFDSISCWYVPPEAIPLVKELMLRISEDIDVKNTESEKLNGTPLMFAVKFGVENAVIKLIERGAKIEAVDKFGCNALHWASFYGCESCLKVLLRECKTAQTIDAQDTFGRTPLILGAQVGRQESVKILLQSGANIKITDKNDKTAYHIATIPCAEIIKGHETNLKN